MMRPHQRAPRDAGRADSQAWERLYGGEKPPPGKRTARRAGRAVRDTAQGDELHANHAAAVATAQALCACCWQPISGASGRIVGAHRSCWIAAGERLRRIPVAKVERQIRAEIAAWREEYETAERRLMAEGQAA